MLESLARLGYASKAVIYGIVGVFALLALANRGGLITDTSGALRLVPKGREIEHAFHGTDVKETDWPWSATLIGGKGLERTGVNGRRARHRRRCGRGATVAAQRRQERSRRDRHGAGGVRFCN